MPAPRPTGPATTRDRRLDALPLFASLRPATQARLRAVATVRTLAAGATLFRAGEPATGIFIVLEGQVRVVRARDGRQSVVHTEGPGGTLAEVPVFDGGVFPTTAAAVSDVVCLHLHRDALVSIMRDDPEVALLFLRRLSTRVRHLVDRLDRVSTQPVVGRLAALLLARVEETGSPTVSLGMTQAAAAEELGTVREVIVRSLATLRHDGVIATAGRGRVVVRDLEALRARAAG
ncbi:MAG: Crp/Fnr family transcriptional regulator [Gemmatimonadetes bacterium]|nr:Crp/Fnr family transcriptional regulator [Gemmatimonadota bacterium]